MPAAPRSFTAAQVAAVKKDGLTRVAPNLYIQVREQGTRSWMFRYSKNGENKWMGLGAVADKPFTEARDEAAELKARVRRGGDPLAEKRQTQIQNRLSQRPNAPTFDQCAKQ